MATKSPRVDKLLLAYIFIFFIALVAPIILEKTVTAWLQAPLLIFLGTYLLRKSKAVDLLDALFLIFAIYSIAITGAHGALSAGIFYSLSILPLIAIFVRHELRRSNRVIAALFIIYAVMVIANFISMFTPTINSDGTLRYLLGGKNALAIVLIPAMFFITYRSYLNHNKLTISSVALLALAIISIFIGGSSTGIVIALLSVITIPFIARIKPMPKLYAGIILTSQSLPIYSSYLASLPYVSDFITGFLGKTPTLSGRTEVWDVSMKAIDQSFFGYGKGNSIVSSQIAGLSETHNLMLELLVTGGIVLLLIFVAVVVISIKRKKKDRKYDTLYRVSLIFLVLYFILGLTESVPFKLDLWIMLAVMSSGQYIKQNQKEVLRAT